MISILLLVLVLGMWLIHFQYKRKRLYELASKLPSISGEIPILGHAYKFLGDTEKTMTVLTTVSYETMKVGGISKAWLGHSLYTIILDPADLEKVLKTCLEKDDLFQFLIKMAGNGIVFAPVSIWKSRREIMLPALSPKVVAGFMGVFANQSRILGDKLESLCSAGEFEAGPYICKYAFDSVFETLIGENINAQSDTDLQFFNLINRAMNLISERIFRLWYHPDWLYKMFRSKYLEHEECRIKLNEFVDEVISRKRQKVPEELKNETLLDVLIRLSNEKKAYSSKELREELLTVMIAGTDTASVTMSFTLLLLGKYPKIQEKVHEELTNVFEDASRRPVKEDLARLNYLDRVIKESLRLYPPAPFLARKVVHEVKLPSGHTLPAGSGTLINVWGTHRDPKHWGPDAELFDPDRFLPDRYKPSHPCSYIPFLSGPRNCLGYQYAMMVIKAGLAEILRRYKVIGIPEEGPRPNIRTKMDILLKAVDGYNIALEKKVNTKI